MCLTVKLHNIVAYSVTSVIASGLFHCMTPAVSCQHPFRTYNERIGASLEHLQEGAWPSSILYCTICLHYTACSKPWDPSGFVEPRAETLGLLFICQLSLLFICQLSVHPLRNVSSHYAMSAPTAQCQLPLHNVSSNYTMSAWHLSVYT